MAGREEEEDVEANPVFQAMRRPPGLLYDRAARQCWTICVPRSDLVQEWKPTARNLESHVLRPSPYFQDEYVTANERTATVVNGTVTTGEGFPERRVARILFEELHYNADYQPFKIWVIDAVLDGDPPARSVATDGFPAEYSIDAYQRFMASQKETAEVLKEIARRVHEFKSSYLIVKGFTAHAATKVRAVIDQLVPVATNANRATQKLASEPRTRAAFLQMVDGLVLDAMYGHLFAKLSSFYEAEDRKLAQTLTEVPRAQVTFRSLGLRSELWPAERNLNDAIALLSTFDVQTTPTGKCRCLQRAMALVAKAVSDNLPVGGSSSANAVTTDDVLPLMLYLLVATPAAHRTLHTSRIYMREFQFADISSSELGFTLSTFEAVLELLATKGLRNSLDGSERAASAATAAGSATIPAASSVADPAPSINGSSSSSSGSSVGPAPTRATLPAYVPPSVPPATSLRGPPVVPAPRPADAAPMIITLGGAPAESPADIVSRLRADRERAQTDASRRA